MTPEMMVEKLEGLLERERRKLEAIREAWKCVTGVNCSDYIYTEKEEGYPIPKGYLFCSCQVVEEALGKLRRLIDGTSL